MSGEKLPHGESPSTANPEVAKELSEQLDSNSVETRVEGQRSSNELARVQTGVSVEQAEAQFAVLQREFTGVSRASRKNKQQSSSDPEKGATVTAEDEDDDVSLRLGGCHARRP